MTQSLPSFAQAFNSPSLNSISSTSNALPPIHRFRSPPTTEQSRQLTSATSPARPPSTSTDSNSQNNNHRKRSRPSNNLSLPIRDDDLPDPDRLSPRLIQIKEELDFPMLDPPSNAMNVDPLDSPHAPAPSALLPTPAKKRRVTISGTPHTLNLNTDVRIPPQDQTNSTPISPVVIGLSIQRDDPAALEQVRSMLTVKQKQKALIEQRRGSVAGILSTTPTANSASPLDPISDERLSPAKPPHPVRPIRRSPNPSSTAPNTVSRRSQHPHSQQQQPPTLHLTHHPPNLASGPGAHLGPPDPAALSQQAHQPISNPVPSSTPKQNLLPPPISFARRRAGQFGAGKKKPADIVISPRDSHTREQLQPAIQSAPPILLAGQELLQQQQHFSAQFPMAIPRLPPIGINTEANVGGGVGITAGRRPIAGQVPPTPSRFSLQRNNSTTHYPPTSNLAPPQVVTPPNTNPFSARSPPASVAIATSLVPPTPTSLHQPNYSGDKTAFLAPFGLFYDALNDSKQLKTWLAEQLHKSSALMQSLTAQQEKMDELVESLVDRKMVAVREEMGLLHRRVEELEDSLRVARSEMITRRQSVEMTPAMASPTTGVAIARSSGKQQLTRNGAGVNNTDIYTFPPVQPIRKPSPVPPTSGTSASSSVGWRSEREKESLPGSENSSPAPYSTRRLSISAMRLDPPRAQQQQQQQSATAEPPSSSSTSSQSFGLHSPPQTLSLSQQQQQAFRDGLPRHAHGHGHGASASPLGKSGSLSVNSTPVLSYRTGGGHSAGMMGEHRSGSPMDDD